MNFSKFLAVFCFFIASFVGYTYADRDAEIAKAQSYLDKKGEVYFRFSKTTRAEANALTSMISLDNVTGTDVYAYANRKEFPNFLNLNKDFEVLPHPGDCLEPPKMSDYKNPEDRSTWNSFPTWSGFVDIMKKFEADYPKLAKLIEVGKLTSGKVLYYLKISNNVTAEDNGKPEFSYSSTMHGDETTGYITMLHLIDYLLKGYPADAQVKKLVDGLQIYIMPLENPDGTFKGGDNSVSGAIRGNATGADLNRSYPGPIGQEASVQQETKLMMAFYKAHESFALLANFHGGTEVVNYDWDCWTSSEKNHPDWPWLKYLSKQFVDAVHKVSSTIMTAQSNGITEGGDWYVVKGSRQQWSSWYNHSQEITMELSNTKNIPASDILNRWNYFYKSLLKFMENAMYGIQGVVRDKNGKPVKAKVWVEKHDVEKDSIFYYSKSRNGNYTRLIDKGTYDLTFTIPGEPAITKTGIVVEYDKATVVDIGPTDIQMARENLRNVGKQVTLQSVGNGIKFNGLTSGSLNVSSIKIYNLEGKLIRTFVNNNQNSIVWNGDDAHGVALGAGNYIARFVSGTSTGNKNLVLVR
jgi:hypothetical protein